MLSDEWRKQGFHHGERFKVTNIVDYVLWQDDRNDMIGITINFEEADDYHYELEMKEWRKFQESALKDSNLMELPKLLGNFLNENSEMFAFEKALDSHQIKYDKIAFF